MSQASARVLYIDDDAALRRLAHRQLTRRGYDVELAATGDEGVEKVRDGAFDLVAVDHYMPGKDGLATLEALRTLPTPPPVVYVTGSEESRIAVAAMKSGAADYVVKSVGEDFFDLLDNAFTAALEARDLRREKEVAEAKLLETNARLEAMLREVNHRVANSLQLVSAFVHMQAAEVSDAEAKAALEGAQQRITAIAQVHRRLYTADTVDSVDMDDYLKSLVDQLEHTWSTPAAPRRLRLEAEPVRLKTDRAVCAGIIVTELVSNACKYAYPPDAAGEVRVILRAAADDRFVLTIADDGCGDTPGASPKGTGLGSKLVAAMTRTLQGVLTIDRPPLGFAVSLTAHV